MLPINESIQHSISEQIFSETDDVDEMKLQKKKGISKRKTTKDLIGKKSKEARLVE